MSPIRQNDLWDLAAALRREGIIAEIEAETEEAHDHPDKAREHRYQAEQHNLLADALDIINRRQAN